MTYEEAKTLYGEIITPSLAARMLGVKQPAINDYCKRKVLTKIEAEIGGITKTYVPVTEVNQYKLKRNKKNSEEP